MEKRTVTKWLREWALREVHSYATGSAEALERKLRTMREVRQWIDIECDNRIAMGYCRYEVSDVGGESHEDKAAKGEATSFLERAEHKLQAFIKTGNAELLLDLRNYCDLIIARRAHPLYHYASLERSDNAFLEDNHE